MTSIDLNAIAGYLVGRGDSAKFGGYSAYIEDNSAKSGLYSAKFGDYSAKFKHYSAFGVP